jgi:hypothetical protein
MVVQLVILPVGFGRFFPRWQVVRKRTFIAESTSGNDPRRRTAARNPAYIDGEPGAASTSVRQIFEYVRFTEAATTQLKRDKNPVNKSTIVTKQRTGHLH